MIETAFDRIRKVREKSIQDLWEQHYKDGDKVTPVAEYIALEVGVSLSTVKRVIKKLGLQS